jgi:hypothetical protein
LYVGEVMPKSIDALKMRLYVSGSVVEFATAVSVGAVELGLKMAMSPKKASRPRHMPSVYCDFRDCPELHPFVFALAGKRNVTKTT